MQHCVLVDEQAIRECVEGQIYQSVLFEAGQSLARALGGCREVGFVSPRLFVRWEKNTLYILRSRAKAGYLLISGSALMNAPQPSGKGDEGSDLLHVFQRICRFALKRWNNMPLVAPSEQWLADRSTGVIFPFPRSRSTGFRISVALGPPIQRVEKRHGTKILFAYAGGTAEAALTDEQTGVYRAAFEGLSDVRSTVESEVAKASDVPSDPGYHPLILRATPVSPIPFQSYDRWISRLTMEQAAFVLSTSDLPQRVEGPAGTGKTLCLMLRAHFICQEASAKNSECRVLFVAHSEATRNSIEILLSAVCGDKYLNKAGDERQSIEVCTLQEWCGKFIGEREVGSAQYLDQDAMQAKSLRKELIKEIVVEMRGSFPSVSKYLSKECVEFFEGENVEYIADLLQHEIGVMIKGRAGELLESYLALPPVRYGLPAITEHDRRFVFHVYTRYQDVLKGYGSFDTDDIVLTAIGSLDTPIWRRRRPSEGYDAVLIDETHLFNLNELSIFHMITRRVECPRIIFSIDRSQAPGERGITTKMVREVLSPKSESGDDATVKVLFRCSPPIAKLAEAVTAAGAALFTTFENPLVDYVSLATVRDEEVCEIPKYWECVSDAEMVSFVVARHKKLKRDLKCQSNDILLVGTTAELVTRLRDAVVASGQRCVEIVRRGDLEVVQGEQGEAVFVAHPDYVGGLEFVGVLIAGVDDGRVPLADGVVKEESKHFLSFKACNQLYVAVTRARSRVELFMSKERGRSTLMAHAISTSVLTVERP
jgi:hypothetical protein